MTGEVAPVDLDALYSRLAQIEEAADPRAYKELLDEILRQQEKAIAEIEEAVTGDKAKLSESLQHEGKPAFSPSSRSYRR